MLSTKTDAEIAELVVRPKGALIGYMVFNNKSRAGLMKKHPGTKVTELAKLTGAAWKKLSEKGRAPYMAAAAKHKEAYKKQMEVYKEACKIATERGIPIPQKKRRKGKRGAKDAGLKAPKKARTAFAIFSSESRKELKVDYPNKTFGEMSRIVADEWKNIEPAELEEFKARAAAAKAVYTGELEVYEASVVSAGGEAGKAAKKKRKKRDPNRPKKPLTAFLLFAGVQRPLLRAGNPGVSFGDLSKLVSVAWKALKDKSKYENEALALKTSYATAKTQYEESLVCAGAVAP